MKGKGAHPFFPLRTREHPVMCVPWTLLFPTTISRVSSFLPDGRGSRSVKGSTRHHTAYSTRRKNHGSTCGDVNFISILPSSILVTIELAQDVTTRTQPTGPEEETTTTTAATPCFVSTESNVVLTVAMMVETKNRAQVPTTQPEVRTAYLRPSFSLNLHPWPFL